jgi:hypothetical protein
MPIEFRCNHCDKLLRVPDESAGQDAQCPSCGAIVQVPAGGGAAGGPFGGMPGGEAPPADPFQPVNPYQAPAYSAAPPTFRPADGFRSGPPWERDGASFRSFIETVKLGYSFTMFSDMRRAGGLGPPIWFSIIGTMIGLIALLIYILGCNGISLAFVANANGGNDVDFLGPFAVFALITSACVIILAPLGVVLGLFINSGITHLMLIMLKGNNFPFETTFRVVAYSMGLTSLLLVIPVCGYLNGIAQIVCTILGLMSAQEISGGKATAAVLLPPLFCFGLYIGAIVLSSFVAAVAQGSAF